MKVEGRYANEPYIVDDGITLASTPADGDSYGTGETIAIDVELSSRVVLDTIYGVPELIIEMGDGANPVREHPLEYAGVSGTNTLRFEYAVQPSDRDSDGITGSGRDPGSQQQHYQGSQTIGAS